MYLQKKKDGEAAGRRACYVNSDLSDDMEGERKSWAKITEGMEKKGKRECSKRERAPDVRRRTAVNSSVNP